MMLDTFSLDGRKYDWRDLRQIQNNRTDGKNQSSLALPENKSRLCHHSLRFFILILKLKQILIILPIRFMFILFILWIILYFYIYST